MWDRMIEKRNEGGFTLIELLIVIIILAILAAIVVFAVGTTSSNAVAASCNADAKTFETALEAYKAQVGAYPASQALSPNLSPVPNPYINVSNGQNWTGGSATIFGLLGNNGSASVGTATPSTGNTWTSPVNQAVVGPYIRQLPNGVNGVNNATSTKQHYQVYTDGNGGVFLIAPGVNPTAANLTNADNYDITPGICNSFS